jgi:hypothetical protein
LVFYGLYGDEMDQLQNIIAFILLIGIIAFIAITKFSHNFEGTSRIIRRTIDAPWSLIEFTQLRPGKWKKGENYRFSEETVRSFAHRYNGRFDAAILHWEEAPILDVLIEYKFPVNHLPTKMKEEDYFQAGLYSLAMAESGISCSSTKLVIVYCLQDNAKRCILDKSKRNCWNCGEGKIFEKRFKPDYVRKQLKKLDEVWYKKRCPRATPTEMKCRLCPFSKRGVCNYSAI